MAEVIKYGMGQLRYVNTSPSSYMTNQNFKNSPIKTIIASTENIEDSTDTEFYRDIYLSSNDPNFNFVAGTPYLLHLDIPKDISYDCIYQIKMVESLGNVVDTTKIAYQMIKYITVSKAVGTGNTSRVILYPIKNNGKPGTNEDGSYNVKIAITKTLNDSLSINDIVFDESTGKYYIYDGAVDGDNNPTIISSQEIFSKNDTLMEHVWATSDIKTDTVGFDIIFTPRSTDATYSGIFIQMQRTSFDYDIYSETKGVYGRMVNIDHPNWKAEVYELTNLLGKNSVPKEITNIGVYSHPNLLMAINGEEIRVGQSGYYELNDFNINSFAIAASDNKDNFTVDYQYKTTS